MNIKICNIEENKNNFELSKTIQNLLLAVVEQEKIIKYSLVFKSDQLIIISNEENYYFINGALGKNVIYYTVDNNEIFISENVNELLKIKPFSLNDNYFLEHIFTDYFVAKSKETPFDNIYELPPFMYIIIPKNDNKLLLKRYQSIETKDKYESNNLEEQIKKALFEEISEKMKLDNMGILVSGGFDSSLILTIANTISNNNIDVYSVMTDKITKKTIEDTKYIYKIKESIDRENIHYHEIDFKSDWNLRIIDKLILSMGEPLYDQRVLLWYNLFEEARKNNNENIMGGEGADEFWYGYYPMKWNWISKLYYSNMNDEEIFDYFNETFTDYICSKFLNEETERKGKEIFIKLTKKVKLSSLQLNDLSQFMTEYVLWGLVSAETKISSTFNLSLILPFLNLELIDIAGRLTREEHLLETKNGKDLLKKIFQSYLPLDIVNRKKAALPKSSIIDEQLKLIFNKYYEEIIECKLIKKYYSTENLNEIIKNNNFGFYGNVNDFLLQLISIWRFEFLYG